MSGVWRLAWSIALSGWRANYNRSFRFSRLKTAVIALVLQGLFFWMIARRAPAMSTAGTAEGLTGVLALMGIQMGWFGMMTGFSRGQFQLYQGILVPLFQMTPARPLAFLLGRVIESVPQRAWSTLLWAWVYSPVVATSSRFGYALLLALFGLAIGMVAHLSGLLLLTFWNRYSPKTARNGLFLFGGLTLALATWAVIFLSKGGTVTDLAETMRQYRILVGAGVLLLGGIPGLLLLAALLVRPGSVEDLYRQGVYNVIELGESEVTRPQRSLWLPLRDGVLRAVLSREWLQLSRSKIARIQMMIWVAGTVGVYVAGRSLTIAPIETVVQYVGSLSLLAWFLAFGHWVVRVFEQERVTVALYRLAAIPTWKLLVAKFIAVAGPSMLLVLGSTFVGCVGAGCQQEEWLYVLGWTVASLFAGVIGGFGMAAATAGEEPEDPEVTAGPRREMGPPQGAGNAWWSVARTVALLLTAAIPIWTGAGQPGLEEVLIPGPILWAVSLLLPLGLLAAGSWLMIRIWEANG